MSDKLAEAPETTQEAIPTRAQAMAERDSALADLQEAKSKKRQLALQLDQVVALNAELLEALEEANGLTKLYPGHPGQYAELIAKARGQQ